RRLRSPRLLVPQRRREARARDSFRTRRSSDLGETGIPPGGPAHRRRAAGRRLPRHARVRHHAGELGAGVRALARRAGGGDMSVDGTPVKRLVTTLGPRSVDELGMILPHEHVFVDLRSWDQPGYGEADPDDVVRLMTPEIEAARAAGVTAIVEPSTVGVGRRVDILLAVSRATGFPLVAPTGVYREPWLPPWVRDADEHELRGWMIRELTVGIEDSDVRAGWIKVGASDAGVTPMEAKVLRAAAAAAIETGAAIGSHTVRGEVAR